MNPVYRNKEVTSVSRIKAALILMCVEPATAVLSELHTLKRSSTSSSVPDNWKAVKQETIVEPVTKEEEDVRYKKLKVDSSDYAENVVGISQPMIRQSKTSSQNRKFNTGDRRTRQLNGSSLFIPRNKQGGVRAKRTQNWTQEGLAPGSSLVTPVHAFMNSRMFDLIHRLHIHQILWT